MCLSDIRIYSPIALVSANENTIFLYNHIENCKPSEYFDVNYFLCRECDPQLNLIPSTNGKKLTLLQRYRYGSQAKEKIEPKIFVLSL